jgi:hypothetical protein
MYASVLHDTSLGNKIANGVLHDVEQRLYPGILYFPILHSCNNTCINTISLMVCRKVFLLCTNFMKPINDKQHYLQIFVPNFIQMRQYIWKVRRHKNTIKAEESGTFCKSDVVYNHNTNCESIYHNK